MSRLTIIIPYFKRRFLREALASLARQTCQDFEVFVGDDLSPEDPVKVLCEFSSLPGLRYQRFAENLGSHSVVQQWDRCVRETNSPWVWLFSDDDVLAPDCVQEFYDTLGETGGQFDVYRFQSSRIDAEGRELQQNPPNPDHESAALVALCRLIGHREFDVQDVSSRAVPLTAKAVWWTSLAACSATTLVGLPSPAASASGPSEVAVSTGDRAGSTWTSRISFWWTAS